MIRIFLYPFSLLYGMIVYIRNLFFDYKILTSTEFETPVISVGNITVGGTGKTPHTEYLINLLRKEFRVAVLSRGYKRKTNGFVLAGSHPLASEIGDEPMQMKNKYPEVTVAVDERRVRGIHNLMKADKSPVPDVILLDDAYQHRHVTPGINILLIDYNRPIWDDHMLPFGRLRESAEEMTRANIIIITKCPEEIPPITRRIIAKNLQIKPYQNLFFSTIRYDDLRPAFPDKAIEFKTDLKDPLNILLVTGIANPKPLHNHLSQLSNAIYNLNFSDHHNFTASDIETISKEFSNVIGDRKIIVTTEKDWMRLREIDSIPPNLQRHLFILPIRIDFLDNERKAFDGKILNYVRENISNTDLQKKEKQAHHTN
ncbi:MAG: tetraacyldisaccharide 4'-kinase [Bacteroidota bacterium]|nr:tetraacyldisaccharide 4'-kinase [Bacteroidota bacterium]